MLTAGTTFAVFAIIALSCEMTGTAAAIGAVAYLPDCARDVEAERHTLGK